MARLWSRMRAHWRKALLGLTAVCIAAAFCADELWSSDVPRGVSVLGLDLSGEEAREAERRVGERAQQVVGRKLVVDVGSKRTSLTLQEAGFSVDVPRTVARARQSGRARGMFARFGGWAARWFRSERVPSVVRVDAAALEAALGRIELETLDVVFPGGVRLEGERFVPLVPRGGSRLARAEARRALEHAIEQGGDTLRLSVERVPEPATPEQIAELARRANELASASITLVDVASPRTLTLSPRELRRAITSTSASTVTRPELVVDPKALEAVVGARRSELESAPVSARFVIDDENQVQIVPSEPEARVHFALLSDAVLAAALSPTKRGVLPLLREVEPALTTDAARGLGITGLVSTFTTRHPCCEKRVENIHRIADLLDGLLVKPGETVSVNTVVGPRTAKNGFVLAPTIEEGAMVDSIGGGISQFATTFFNALFYGGYDIIERQPHTYWFPRYPMGHEATLSYPKPDLIFRNDTDAGMLIDTVYTKTTITVRLFGNNGGRKVTAEVSSRQNVVEPPVEIVGNPALAPDEEKTRDAGMIGWTVMVGRIITFPDGKKKEERRRVTYRPKPRQVEVHPCRVPKGEKGYTGEPCPEPEDAAEALAAESSEPQP